ncbi:MAG: peroxiredoxin [Thermoleophilia bacterium]
MGTLQSSVYYSGARSSPSSERQVPTVVQVGQQAPDFSLEGVLDGKFVDVRLSDYRGNWVVLFFYPLDFTFVCPTEIRGFAARLNEFEDLDAQVIGVSVDSKYSHMAWVERDLGKLGYPLLSDMTREVTREYGVLLESVGHSLRGTFVVDPEGVLRYMVVHDNNIGRNMDEVLRVLQALQTGELCPIDWRPGEATLTPPAR